MKSAARVVFTGLLGLLAVGVLAACEARTSASRATAARGMPPPKAPPCANCHSAEAAEWESSLHHTAFTDRDFQASFALEPDPFCFRCHAPEASDRADTRGISAGVGCVSCHDVGLGHGVEQVVARTTACASCHEFAFPARPALMQSTVSEHSKSAFATDSCASCHLPRKPDGHRDHRFDVSRNVALLRESIAVAPRRTETGVAVVLTTRSVGHAMPTGDLFRRLRIVVRGADPDGRHVGEDERLLARRFDRRRGIPIEAEDTRVVGERQVAFDAPWLVFAARIDIELRYERVAQTMDVIDVRGERQHRDVVFASEVVFESSLSEPRPPRER